MGPDGHWREKRFATPLLSFGGRGLRVNKPSLLFTFWLLYCSAVAGRISAPLIGGLRGSTPQVGESLGAVVAGVILAVVMAGPLFPRWSKWQAFGMVSSDS